jgi:endonuclease YncB( thermonuclease family)
MKRQVKHSFGALLLTVAIAAGPAGTASAIEFVNGPAAAVTGDSITVGGVGHPNTMVRLWGIQAPEMSDDRDYGLYARAFLDDLLRQNGGQVKCVTDSFDRSSAVCHAGTVDLGEAMLKTGWAVADRTVTLADVPGGDSERSKRAEAYHEAEAQARAGRKGRWARMP